MRIVNAGQGVAVNIELTIVKGKKRTKMQSITALTALKGRTDELSISEDNSIDLNLETIGPYTIEAHHSDIKGNFYIAIIKTNYLFNDRFEIIKQEPL